ncbi:MAG: hypothetical protein EPN72_01785 [Nevskiaceae bacterium]|nr:MAG: hypothetical protein EPN63_12535 [Nevskiaceae bacterium]TBR74768.1 MAG: hypothetical protein EPN72_01785 [Nevskiaceae bacterium]
MKVRYPVMVVGMAIACLLTGCVTTREVGQRQGTQTGTPVQPALPAADADQSFTPALPAQPPAASYPTTLQESGANPAVLALYGQAQQQQGAGALEQAANSLERAMRLAPRNPFLWDALARLHLKMQQPDQAQNAAYKAISLADNNPNILRGSWSTIAASRQALGDASGAASAQANAQKYAQLTSGW